MSFPKLGYYLANFGGDLAGGAIAALIALPYGLAMANMMGLPPVLGLVTSITTAPITAILGRNPVLIGGTASATVPFIAQAVQPQGIGGAAKVCIVASVFMLIFCVFGWPLHPEGAASGRDRLLLRHRRHDVSLPTRRHAGRENGS